MNSIGEWIKSLGFGSAMIFIWSLFFMFFWSSWMFGFDNTVESLGGFMDRVGLEASAPEGRENE